jgi:hypothetical protein
MKTDGRRVHSSNATGAEKPGRRHPLTWTLLLLVAVLSVLFHRSHNSRYTLFSNDCPLGRMTAEQNRPPGTLTGSWSDLNWLGSEGLNSAPTLSNLMLYLPTPNIWSRFEQPFTLSFVGLGACFCFRRLKLAPLACILGGLAASLNSDFFSTSSPKTSAPERQRSDHGKRKPGFCRLRRQTGLRFTVPKKPSKLTRPSPAGNNRW